MSSKSRHEKLILYLDRNLGSKIVPAVLRQAGIHCEIHDDHLPQDAADQKWIELCSKNNWIAITKDAQLKYNQPIKEAIESSTAGIIILTATNLTGVQLGELIVQAHEVILRFVKRTERPFLCKLNRLGKISAVPLAKMAARKL